MKYAAWWLVAAVVATLVGVLGVTWSLDSVRVRGPLGDNEAIRTAELNDTSPRPDPDEAEVRTTLTGDWGSFEVGCRGVYAYGLATTPDRADGWRVIAMEEGPDDDVDALFANDETSVDLEVYCNRGRPTLAEEERHARP